jgi:hypothetical protein
MTNLLLLDNARSLPHPNGREMLSYWIALRERQKHDQQNQVQLQRRTAMPEKLLELGLIASISNDSQVA